MGLDPDRALGAVRLSLGRWTSEKDIETAAAALIGATAVPDRASRVPRGNNEEPAEA
nr:hypothetical protein [Streptomyces sp. S1D4-11]